MKTNRSGVAKQSYRRDSKVAQHETVDALYVVGKRDGAFTEPNEEDNDTTNDGTIQPMSAASGKIDGAMTEPMIGDDDIRGDADADTMGSQDMSHYWATAVENMADGDVLVADTDANTDRHRHRSADAG